MSYIGNPPAEAYTNTVKDTFSGDGSTVAFTLSLPTTTNNVRVVVENVIQDPTVAYGVSGTTLTFTSAPPSGTNNIYVVHLGPAVQTVVPPDSVTITDLNAYADGAAAFTTNRATSDGTIIDLQKDGSSVGSIGTQSGDLIIDSSSSNHSGLRFSSPAILPRYNGALADNQVDLGQTGSNYRFKDLYLSGGVYLGGTGAANYLDDYEEGTWTVEFTDNSGNTSSTTDTGYYTKTGRQVTATFSTSNIDTTGLTGGDPLFFTLPFTVDYQAMGSVRIYADILTDTVSICSQGSTSNARGSITQSRDNNTLQSVDVSQLISGASDLSVTITYFTDS